MRTADPMWHDLGAVSPYAYEWLYFDVLDQATQTHVSIDFLAPNPFEPSARDPRDRVGVIACISRLGQPGIESDFVADRTKVRFQDDVRFAIGDSSVTRRAGSNGLPVFDLELSYLDIAGRRVTGNFTFESVLPEWTVPGSRFYEAADDPNRYHRWIVHAPRARTTGNLLVEGGAEGRIELDVCGHGYHDHNLGTVPLAATVQRWFWARGSDDHHTVIAAHLVPKQGFESDRWLQSVVYVSSDTTNIAAATGNENVFSLENNTKGGNGVDFPALVRVESRDSKRRPVELAFKQQAMAIDGHPGYLRRYVELSLSVGPEPPAVFPAVAEDIAFP